MNHRFIKVDSIINRVTKKDGLFHGDYTIDPYQYCEYSCVYCDSSNRHEIIIKSNAAEILKREIKQMNKGLIIIGSVHDPYQPAEEKYKMTRCLLEIISEYNNPCHILTKSPLVLRDVDVLSRIKNCFVTISMSTIQDNIVNLIEPYTPSPLERLKTIKKLREKGITAGLAMIPLLPGITDAELEDMIRSAVFHDSQYILYKPLMLAGDQRVHFLDLLERNLPSQVDYYKGLYKGRISPPRWYTSTIGKKIKRISNKYKIPDRMPYHKKNL